MYCICFYDGKASSENKTWKVQKNLQMKDRKSFDVVTRSSSINTLDVTDFIALDYRLRM